MPTHLEPFSDKTLPSFIGVSTPVDTIYEIKMIRRKNPIEIEAFFSFSLFENNPLREKISVAKIVIKRMILASSIIGVTKL